jgi:hypothetical protein
MMPSTLRFKRSSLVAFFGLCCVELLCAAPGAFASVITNSPSLPPNTGSYQSGAVHATYNYFGTPVVIENISHTPNAGAATQNFTASPGNEIDTFPSTVTGLVSVGLSPFVPFTLSDPATSVEVFGRTSDTQLGSFNTKMLSLDLTGIVLGHSVEINLDPGNPTVGQTTISDQGGGMFQITSFFDVFTEISLDGGPFAPQIDGPTLVNLEPSPEPASMTLLAIGGVAGVVPILRRRRTA